MDILVGSYLVEQAGAMAPDGGDQANSVPLKGATVLHFKGGWHPVLLGGRAFGGHWLRQTSEEMYRLWMSYLAEKERALGMRLLPAWVCARRAIRDRFSQR